MESNGWEIDKEAGTAFAWDFKQHDIKEKILMDAIRPTIPEDTPPFLHSLITECWDQEPSKRKKIEEVCRILSTFLELPVDNETEEESKDAQPSLRDSKQELVAPDCRIAETTEGITYGLYFEDMNGVERIWLSTPEYMCIWDAKQGSSDSELIFSQEKSTITCMLYSDGLVWTGSEDGIITIWNAGDNSLVSSSAIHSSVTVMTEVNDNSQSKYIITADISGSCYVWRRIVTHLFVFLLA